MNMIVDVREPGFVENGWVGRALKVGEGATLRVAIPDPRCVMTTLPQGDLPQDAEIFRTVTMHNKLEIAGAGRYPCAGVYATVSAGGKISIGDPVQHV